MSGSSMTGVAVKLAERWKICGALSCIGYSSPGLAWQSSSSKNKPSPSERAALARLESVRRQRAPFTALARRLIATTLEAHLPSDGAVVEIGMGDGQLRERLPEPLLTRVVHTEPFAAASRAFRKRHPDVAVLQAGAEKLPFETGGVTAVLASCVMDVVPDGAQVTRELARVLGAGGRFIHFLDMSTLLTPVVAALGESGLVPLPNVFADPAEGRPWPEDLFLVPREQLALVVAVLGASSHPLARPLGQYLSVFTSSPFAVGKAAAELAQLQDDSSLRAALKSAFRAAFELAPPAARQQLSAFQGRPVSSARSFEQRLRAWFHAEAGFQVELAEVRRVWEQVPREAPGVAYRSCYVGEQRQLPYVPETLLSPDAEPAGDEHTLLELGVFVFVASRI